MDIITLALAKKFAKEYTDTHASKITEEDAIQAVANYFNENPNAIVTKNELEIILDNIPAGNDGKSAYEYAQEGGFIGTEEEFSQKLATDLQLDDSLKDNTKAAPAGFVGEIKSDLGKLSEEIANILGGKDNVNSASKWKGKTLNFMGDSITEGYASTVKYTDIIASTLSATCNNYGSGGCTVENGL